MRALFLIVRMLTPIVCLTLCAGPGTPVSSFRVETRAARLAYGSKLWVRNRNGAIRVTGWDKQELLLTAQIRDSAKRRIELVLARVGDDLEIEARYQQAPFSFLYGFVASPRCEMTLSVPYRLLAHFRTTNGAIAVTHLEGYARCETTNGDITLNQLAGEAVAETCNGSLAAKGLKCRLRGGTSNGGILLDGVEGMVKLETTNGQIQARNLDGWGEGISLESSNGSIDLQLGAASGDLLAETSNGSIEIELPGAHLLESSKHRVQLAIPGKKQRIALETTNGSIHIH